MDYLVYPAIIGLAGIVFLAIILILATPPKYTKKIMGWIVTLSVIAALGMYGYGYGYEYLHGDKHTFVTGIILTVFDACRIIVGSNNWSEVKEAYVGMPAGEIFFWVVHLLAMTTCASAVVVSLGSNLLKRIRLRLLRMHDVTLVFGLSENTLDFGRELLESEKTSILYVDGNAESILSTAVDQMGGILRSDTDALYGNSSFLKSIGLKPGKRKLHVYALNKSVRANQQFARRLLATLEQQKILPEQTTLTILSTDDEMDDSLQASAERYGYGSLLSINEPDMVARILIRNYPPYRYLTFDKTGAAVTDFHAVLVGFGEIGQAVLRQLVMNSQFKGSSSKIVIFSPDYEKRMGWLSHEYREMLNHYDITMYPFDARSNQFYDYLTDNLDSINYIAICVGNETLGQEIGERMQQFLLRRSSSADILLCSRSGVTYQFMEENAVSCRIYTPAILCSHQIDQMAMVLNHSYIGKGNMLENWEKCSYFDRMSSRAAADFYGALLYSAGVTPEEALENWDPQGVLLENLAASEHLRWNAFHYCMGFRPMTEEEYLERVKQYLLEKEQNPETKFRIAKDMEKRIHACMISWDALDAYSAKENAITGDQRDYAESDRRNVRNVAKILQVMKQNKFSY